MTTLRRLLLACCLFLCIGCVGLDALFAMGAALHDSSRPPEPRRPLICHTRTSRTDTTTDTATWCE